jgi:hypothetical protein
MRTRKHKPGLVAPICPDCGKPSRGKCADCYSLELVGRKPLEPFLDLIFSNSI